MASFASVQEFRDRLDDRIVLDLVSSPEGEVDEARIGRALDDATGELEGWIVRLPEALRPSENTLRVHCLKVATYLLTLDRPGKEFEQIRNAYTDTIDFYKTLEQRASQQAQASGSPLGVSSCAPDRVFSERALKGLV